MPNRLAASTSPYLRQHAENPVDRREWGEDAFAEARERDVPVLLGVGDGSCHWCHLMADQYVDSGSGQPSGWLSSGAVRSHVSIPFNGCASPGQPGAYAVP